MINLNIWIWWSTKNSVHVIVNAIFKEIVLTFVVYVENHIPHMAHFFSWHSNNQFRRYSVVCELFQFSGIKCCILKKVLRTI
jgi:hypothetical protein